MTVFIRGERSHCLVRAPCGTCPKELMGDTGPRKGYEEPVELLCLGAFIGGRGPVSFCAVEVSVDAVVLAEGILGCRVANEINFVATGKGIAGFWIDMDAAVQAVHGEYAAASFGADFTFPEGCAGQIAVDSVTKDGKSFTEHEHPVWREKVDDGVADKGGKGEHEIGTGHVQAIDVALQ